jgi:acyl carrier protein
MDKKIQAAVAEVLGCDEADVTENAHLYDDLGADSLDAVEIVMAIEEAFDIVVSDEEADKCKTAGDLQNLVTKLKAH